MICLQLKGYDHPILEAYTSLIQKIAKKLDINVLKYWATPCTTTKFDTLKEDSDLQEFSYKINLYERNIQLKHLTVTQAPLFLHAIQAAKPPGVTISVHKHEDYHDTIRYIPDLHLAELVREFEELNIPVSVLAGVKGKKK